MKVGFLSQSDYNSSPFRFFDNREKYLLFVNTCNEKQVIAERISMDVKYLRPSSLGLRVFDAGMGDGSVLTRVMRQLHDNFPKTPFSILGKEISQEDLRISLDKMSDRFVEHPQTVLTVTNMFYPEATNLRPNSSENRARLNWKVVELEGTTSHQFDTQIRDLEPLISEWWRTKRSSKTNNPIYSTPSVIVFYRKDQKDFLSSIIPENQYCHNYQYDLIIAAQPFRSRVPAQTKVKNVLAPLAKALAKSGLMIVIQSIGKDPGMEIIRRIWPDEKPFQSPRRDLIVELKKQLELINEDFTYIDYVDSRAEFNYHLQLPSDEMASSIGTSTTLAAWNAAIYVAQIEDERVENEMRKGTYLDVTQEVLRKYDGLWFSDESFIVTKT